MDWSAWLDDYDARYQAALFGSSVRPQLLALHALAFDLRASGRKLLLMGNGASASIASHGAVDFTKQGRVRAVDFNEPNLITCLGNDFGFAHVFAKALEYYGDPGDVMIGISVSGRSANVLNAAEQARKMGIKVVSFTGSAPDNPLRSASDVGFWVDSRAYNIVESVHMIWLTTVVDMLVGRAEYSVA
jgi:D-sedoheptulose 7-phosphate isomerase